MACALNLGQDVKLQDSLLGVDAHNIHIDIDCLATGFGNEGFHLIHLHREFTVVQEGKEQGVNVALGGGG